MTFFAQCSFAQKTKQVKYLSQDLAFTSKSKSAYVAVATPENDRWLLVSVYADSSSLLKIHFSDSKLKIKDGAFVLYYLHGIKAIEGNYVNNERMGTWKSWYNNGQIKDSGLITHDAATGPWTSWYKNGTTMKKLQYVADISTINNDTKRLASNSFLDMFVRPSVKNGTSQSWYENAHAKDSGNYILDRKNGYWISWFENGSRESEGYYSNDTLKGKWIFYHEEGSISTKEQYHNNLLTSLACFDTSGNFTGASCSVAKPPVLLGYPYDWPTFLTTHLQWSRQTLQRSDPGMVRFELSVSKDGMLTGYTILESPDDLVSDDVKKVLALMTNWSPAILHNRPIAYSFTYAIYFSPV